MFVGAEGEGVRHLDALRSVKRWKKGVGNGERPWEEGWFEYLETCSSIFLLKIASERYWQILAETVHLHSR